MNVNANIAPLPSILEIAQTRPGRREHIDDFHLDEYELERFNGLLAQLGRRQGPLDRDRLVTAARELSVTSANGVAAPCIGQRMRRVAAAAWMIADPDWTAANDARDVAGRVVAYARGQEGLIPNRVPKVGRLDDAIVIDAAWPRLAGEIEYYVDFRRLLRIEAALRGSADRHFGFNRAQWQLARSAEAALIAHQRQVRVSSYLPRPSAMFRVN